MRKMIAILKYELRIYFKNSRFVMPLIVTAVFVYLMNYERTASIEMEFAVICYVVFCITAWVGAALPACEDTVMEQIQFLRVKGSPLYFAAKIAALAAAGLVPAGLCMIYPVMRWITDDMLLFGRPPGGGDILAAALVFAGCSFAGGALGSLLHPGVMPDRKAATMLTTLLVLLCVIKKPVMAEIPFLKYFLWLLPPVEKAAQMYGGGENCGFAQICGTACVLFLYGAAYSVARCAVCYGRKGL